MRRAVIIEDEKAVAKSLISTLRSVDARIEVTAILNSVEESITYLNGNNDADIIFSDVQLTDGLSFSIFNAVNVVAPIIFVTAYDKFMMNSFEYNSIDYLLKPVSAEDLKRALDKYSKLEKHFSGNGTIPKSFFQNFVAQKRTRIIVKKGLENISLLLDDVVLFYTENKIVYVIDKNGKKYIADKNLGDLEQELEQKTFFRVNRQYILNINFIRSFKTYERVKLQIELTVPDLNHYIIVSQETAPLFRKWISEA